MADSSLRSELPELMDSFSDNYRGGAYRGRDTITTVLPYYYYTIEDEDAADMRRMAVSPCRRFILLSAATADQPNSSLHTDPLCCPLLPLQIIAGNTQGREEQYTHNTHITITSAGQRTQTHWLCLCASACSVGAGDKGATTGTHSTDERLGLYSRCCCTQ